MIDDMIVQSRVVCLMDVYASTVRRLNQPTLYLDVVLCRSIIRMGNLHVQFWKTMALNFEDNHHDSHGSTH